MSLSTLKTFAIEQWMDWYESIVKYNIAETWATPISLEELQALSEDKSSKIWDASTKLNYGSIRGSHALHNILITPEASTANLSAFYGLRGKGDHVICHYPTYQQLYEVPASLGAEVDFWRAREDRQWQLDIAELKALIKPNTKMIIINNPNNPTGAIIPKSTLHALVELAEAHDLIVFSDEVYRPLFHSISPLSPDFPPSVLSLPYSKSLVIGSLSKAYSLAGIRVGWIASRSPEIIAACTGARHYTCISVSQLDDQIAAFALSSSCVHSLLARTLELARTNLGILETFVKQHPEACQWIKPVAATTAFIKFSRNKEAVDDVELCKTLIEKTGVMISPGSWCFGDGKDFKGYVRVGYVCQTVELIDGLEQLSTFMKHEYENVALAK
ncbi:hypothetical protein MMC22_005829 [Lobaria immixta]|nr:hypothetical protein [Lobaria immixta]